MAEIFNNYLTKKTYSNGNSQVIVPIAGAALSDNNTIGSRTANSVCQLHSIYITKEVSGDQSSNPLPNAAHITLSVRDKTTNEMYDIANNVFVLPHSSFYIEKTITLKAQQELVLTFLSSTQYTLHTVCSGVDIY